MHLANFFSFAKKSYKKGLVQIKVIAAHRSLSLFQAMSFDFSSVFGSIFNLIRGASFFIIYDVKSRHSIASFTITEI